jgi:hypothetical protein
MVTQQFVRDERPMAWQDTPGKPRHYIRAVPVATSLVQEAK